MPEIIYSVSIKSFPDYKHLLQKKILYVEYKHFFLNVTQEGKDFILTLFIVCIT